MEEFHAIKLIYHLLQVTFILNFKIHAEGWNKIMKTLIIKNLLKKICFLSNGESTYTSNRVF